ncbi:MAG: NAD-dependent epimerase/dehydratase family protein [Myxococcales bacterium]|nr:NAD-dependent epimerase/dehydratase family protein [Myxococcales bacterium]MCB9530882.1 NAD-dependent epimerase/dehydratase family protein [Myxococcales bacterium]MCB9534338.1 NAD-dependent epimerase/dehydratase family protein [Myxococcales bacterium]
MTSRVLVTGAGGFLGMAISARLVARGDEVVGINRGDYPALRALGVDARVGDLADGDAVLRAAEGCDAVLHVAAKAGVWGPREEYVRSNVVATQNVLEACRRHGIPRLVYTSTPSVVHGGESVEGVDESAPYPSSYSTHYPSTKAEAERAVLASSSASLATVALRPHLIWGPGDNHLVPRIVDRARRGRLAFVGDGKNRVDATYIDNAAEAHICALDRLVPGAACAGKAYFITNGEPIALEVLVNGIVRAAGLPPVTRRVPFGVAYAIGGLLELIYGTFGVAAEPPMTRFVAEQLSTSHWYRIDAARAELGYEPKVTTDEGLERLARHLAGA